MGLKPGYKQTEVGVIPEEWECGKLEEYFSFISYGFTNPMPTVDHGIFMVTAADINEGRIQLETARKTTEVAYRTLLSPKSKPKRNDILLTKDGSLGRLAVVGNDLICINQSVAVIRPNEKVEPNFLKLLLESPRYQRRMLDDAGGSTIKHIYITIVNLMPIALPPSRDEQRAIAGALSDVDALIGALDQFIAKKRDLKQATMQQLLTGQKRLPGFGVGSRFKQTDVGQIPEDWRVEAVGEISLVGRGRVISHREIAVAISPLYPVYSSQTSNNGIMGYLDTFEFEGEYITWTTDGANAGTVFHRNGRFNCTNVCGTIKLNRDNAVFVSKVLAGIAPRHVSRNLGNPKLMNDVMKRILVPLPPSVAEQTATADVLSEMVVELAALEQRRDKTRALKQGMMQELLTGKTRLVDKPRSHE